MKKYFIAWLLLLCCSPVLQAQEKLSEYIFPDFKEAVVQYTNGAQTKEKMNYNVVTNKFNFVDKKDNQIKELSDTRIIFMITIGHRNFMPDEDGMTEVFATTPTVYAQYRAKSRTKAPEAGFGGTSDLTSTRTYVANTGGGSQYFGYDTRMNVTSYYNYYWIDKDSKRKQFKSFKEFLKIYPKKKASLEAYIKDRKLDFMKPGDVINLCMYAEGVQIPLVYPVENTGAAFPKPVTPALDQLPVVKTLPDPFQWSDGSGRSTDFMDWSRRRAEIAKEIEHYEIGEKPVVDRKNMTATLLNDTLTVTVALKGQTLTLKAKITYPAGGTAPYPAIIGIGKGSGSLPEEIFSSRNVAQISFNFSQVMSHTQKRGNEPINKLYPDLVDFGAYSAWPWGVSRLIDGLEIVGASSKIDLKHLAISGCSFAGKMALFAGAFDERIALTIAQEPGGGGAAAWRVSETLGEVETLGRTSHAWFMESMFQFKEENVNRLPFDHHELCALIAPRALLVLGNPDYKWLADESGYVSCQAARKVWETFGIADRMGFSIVGGHPHCALPTSQYPEVEAFVDKFLLGKKEVNTNVTIAPLYEQVDYKKWINW